MMDGVGDYIAERFPLYVTIPLTMIILGSSLVPNGANETTGLNYFLPGWVSLFLAFFSLRAADDLSDIEFDRENHGERALTSGRVKPETLERFLVACVLFVIVVNMIYMPRPALLLASATILYYAVFFSKLKTRLPFVVRAFFSNAVFALTPIYGALLSDRLDAPHVFLSLFVYVAAIAHEWAHNVHSPEDAALDKTRLYVVGRFRAEAVASALFILSDICGWMFWLQSGMSIAFGLFLFITTVQIARLSIRLVKSPSKSHAKPFYVYGFVFFALPLAALFAEYLIGAIR